jgi:hypothetical protein
MADGLVNPDAELDLRTAYPDGPVVRLATLSEFLDTQPWGRSTRLADALGEKRRFAWKTSPLARYWMSEENMDAVKRAPDAYNGRGVEALLDEPHPEVEVARRFWLSSSAQMSCASPLTS